MNKLESVQNKRKSVLLEKFLGLKGIKNGPNEWGLN